MRLKPKTARRLLLAAVLLIVVVSGAVGLLGVRHWQRARGADRLRAEGMALFERQQWYAALGKLASYLRPNPTDREALLAYATCREHVEEPDGKHLIEAVAWYKRCFEMDPADAQTGRTMVRLYNQIGFFHEAADYARRLLPQNLGDAGPEHAPMIRAEASARAGIRKFAQSADPRLEDLIHRALELDPLDFSVNLLYLGYLRETGRADQALAHAQDLRAKWPQDGRAAVLAVLARGPDAPGGAEDLLSAVCGAVGLDPATGAPVATTPITDMEFTGRALGILDSLGRFTHSMGLLRRVAGADGADDYRRIFARRAWAAGFPDQVVDLVATRRALQKVHTDLLAFDALSRRDLGRATDVAAIVAELEGREGDFRARSWAPVLRSLDAADPRELARILAAAVKEHPGEPVLSYFHGRALAALGRPEEARTAWQQASDSPLAVGWDAPLNALSSSYLAEGRIEEAVKFAEAAFRVAPTGLAATVALLEAQGALIEAGAPLSDPPEELLARAERALAQVATLPDKAVAGSLSQILVPRRILLTLRAGSRDQAKALVRRALDGEGPLQRQAFERLAALCAREGLGLELECLDAAEKQGGPSASTVLSRAIVLHRAGRTGEGLGALRRAAESAPKDQQTIWQIALAQFLDTSGDPSALPAWVALADGQPENLTVQRAALAAHASAGDLAFIERLSERVARLSGAEQGGTPTFAARLALARALVNAPTTSRARDQAVSLLTALLTEAPAQPEPRALLVRAYLLEDRARGIVPDIGAAVGVLRAAAGTPAQRSAASLQIGELLQRLYDFEGARVELDRVARDRAAPLTARARAVELLAAQRDVGAAIPPLEEIISQSGNTPPVDLILRLAGLYAAAGRDAEALATYRRLAQSPPQNADHLARIAEGLASLKDKAGAATVLADLERLDLPPARRQLLIAGFAQRHGTPEQALDALESAVSVAPADPETWATLVRFHLSRADYTGARAAMGRALAALPDDPGLKVLDQHLRVLETGAADLGSLADAMAQSTALRGKAEIIRAIDELRAAGSLSDPAALAGLAARFPDEPAVHTMVVRLLLQLKPPRAEPAAEAARRALAAFPTVPDVAITAVAAFKAAGDWRDMLKAADAWRQLTRAPEAELAAAEATLESGDPGAALAALAGPVRQAAGAPHDAFSLDVLSLHTRALIRAGRQSEAFTQLAPLIDTAPLVRSRVFLPAAATQVSPETEALRWIEQVRSAMENGSVDDRLALGTAWLVAAERFAESRTDLASRALAVLRPMARPTDAPIPVLTTLAWALRLTGDSPGAAEVLLRALELDPTSPAPLGALGELLSQGALDAAPVLEVLNRLDQSAGGANRPLRRAIALAHEALARRRAAAGDQAAARTSWTAAAEACTRLLKDDPSDLAACLALARAADHLDDHATVIAMYERVLARPHVLTPEDLAKVKNNLAYVLARPGAGADVLDKARALALDAIAIAPVPSFYDTLGTIEAGRGDRSAAINAYRKAISLAPAMHNSRLELAALLANGEAAERKEAATLLAEVEGAGQHPPDRAKRLAEVKAALGTGR